MTLRSALEVLLLRDNHARPGLGAGHGLSMLARTPAGTFLLDTGDSAETWVNADAMNVDLTEATAVVLSHGHYDHTNGLPTLLTRVGRLPVIAHPAVFEPRWSQRGTERVFIGPPADAEELEAMGAELQLSADPVTIIPGAQTTGEVPRGGGLAPQSPHLLVERGGEVIEDDFIDDISVIVSLDEGEVLLTGCAHAGLVNIVDRAIDVVGHCPRAIAGGTHLRDETQERIARVADELTARGVEQIVPLHCSGDRGAELMETHFAGETLRAGVGDTIVADEAGHIAIQ